MAFVTIITRAQSSAATCSPLFFDNLHFEHFDKSVNLDSLLTLLSKCSKWRFMLPKRRFWNDEQKMKCGFSTDFSMVRGPNRVLSPLKSASKIRISSFVHRSKIFVWEGQIYKIFKSFLTPHGLSVDSEQFRTHRMI
jgi:hypothetical protein